jgi:uncharacterized protein involved in exopolysaccharide biosynthesis/Mrp family chromosome partitioning ATPase
MSKEKDNSSKSKKSAEKKATKKDNLTSNAKSPKNENSLHDTRETEFHPEAPLQLSSSPQYKESIELIKVLGDSENKDESDKSQIDFKKILVGIRRHVLLILLLGCLGSAAAVLTTYILNKKYSATSYLLFQQEMPEMLGRHYTMSQLRLSTILQMMKMPQHVKTMKSILGLDTPARKISKMINISLPSKHSDLIKITAHGNDPNLVMDIANALSNVVIKHSQDFNRSQLQSAYDYFNTQLNIDRQRYAHINNKLLEFRKKNPYFEMEQGSRKMIAKAASSRNRYQNALLRYNSLLVEYENLRRETNKIPDQVVSNSYENNPIKDRISQTEMALLHARTRYSSGNPKVKILESTLDELKGMLGDASYEETQSDILAKNPLKLNLNHELMRMRGKLRSAQKLKEDLGKLLTHTQQEISKLPTEEIVFAKLQHRNKVLKNEINTLEEGLYSAELYLRLGEGNIDIYQAADTAHKIMSKWEDYLKFFPLIGFVIGLGFGLFLAGVIEALERKVCTEDQVRKLTPIPYWMQIPEIPRLLKKDVEVETLYYIRNIAERIRKHRKSSDNCSTVGFMSSVSGEGKSCLAYNLAIYYQKRLGKRVLYAGLDSIDNPFFPKNQIPPRTLNEYLLDKVDIDQIIYQGPVDRVRVSKDSNLNELIKSESLNAAWEHWKETYDVIIMDIPGLNESECHATLASMTETNIFVISSSTVKTNYIKQALAEIEGYSIETAGLILNRVESAYVSDVRVSIYKKRMREERKLSKSILKNKPKANTAQDKTT